MKGGGVGRQVPNKPLNFKFSNQILFVCPHETGRIETHFRILLFKANNCVSFSIRAFVSFLQLLWAFTYHVTERRKDVSPENQKQKVQRLQPKATREEFSPLFFMIGNKKTKRNKDGKEWGGKRGLPWQPINRQGQERKGKGHHNETGSQKSGFPCLTNRVNVYVAQWPIQLSLHFGLFCFFLECS